MKKPRSDSKLANLPEEAQAEIFTWCKEGLEVARDMLKAQKDISISLGALSSWRAWYYQQQELRIGNAGVVAILDWFKTNKPDASQSEIRTAMLMGLSLKAQARDDMGAALDVLKEQGKDLDRGLVREKFETETCKKFLLWFKDAKAREIADSGLSNAQKIAALRAEYFKDVDALEASGGVQLPD